ncbi:Lysoplasmalogenase [Tolypocladium ophioglossoides CBS 100239]|uniref:Lysoplasmalogenase n=1 Tax=Tolypocladium ophioglossoides (strain CBS 100239) TaxID=1163406 RepID=A0A0L0NA20_TOLOC|nr:Lysoplasmalogenase [Tolypocladium ophioglossoides CBS 100239]
MGFDNLPVLDTAILVVSASAAILYGIQIRATPSHSRMISKAASTALLSLFATVRGESSLLVPALALGSVGDAFLAWPGEKAFLRGLGSFLAAHIFYIALFARLGSGVGLILSETWRQALATTMLALALVMGFVLVPRVGSALRLPIVVYSSVILAMVLAVLTVQNHQVVLGAVLFALSDSILATDEFVVSADSHHRVWMQFAVWILYYSGQFLIALGL